MIPSERIKQIAAVIPEATVPIYAERLIAATLVYLDERETLVHPIARVFNQATYAVLGESEEVMPTGPGMASCGHGYAPGSPNCVECHPTTENITYLVNQAESMRAELDETKTERDTLRAQIKEMEDYRQSDAELVTKDKRIQQLEGELAKALSLRDCASWDDGHRSRDAEFGEMKERCLKTDAVVEAARNLAGCHWRIDFIRDVERAISALDQPASSPELPDSSPEAPRPIVVGSTWRYNAANGAKLVAIDGMGEKTVHLVWNGEDERRAWPVEAFRKNFNWVSDPDAL